MECEPAHVVLLVFAILATGLYTLVFSPDPDDFPYYARLFPEQAVRRRETDILYEITEGILREGDPGFNEVRETIHRNVSETSLPLRANRIVCSGTHGAGTVVELQHLKGKRSSTGRDCIGSGEEVHNWLETETRRPIRRFRMVLGILAVGLQIGAVLV